MRMCFELSITSPSHAILLVSSTGRTLLAQLAQPAQPAGVSPGFEPPTRTNFSSTKKLAQMCVHFLVALCYNRVDANVPFHQVALYLREYVFAISRQ